MTDIGEWAEARRLKIEQQLIEVMGMIESDNEAAFARRAPLSIAQLNSSVRGRRVLVHAVVHNRVDMVRALLAEGANANLSDSRGLPLFVAVGREPADIDVIRLLLRNGADASVVSVTSGGVALPLAALLLAQSREHLDIVQLLVDQGRAHAWWPTHVYWGPPSHSHFPIVAALERNRVETMHFLLARRSAAIHCEDAVLITHALNSRNTSLLKLFLDAGVSPNVVATNNVLRNVEPPIFTLLLDVFDASVFRMILDAGADVNATNQIGQTPLHLVVQHRLARWIIDALLRRGAKIDAWNTVRGGSPLTLACLAGSLPLAVFLVARGASPDRAIAPDRSLLLGQRHANANAVALSRKVRLLLAALGAIDALDSLTSHDTADFLLVLNTVEKERFRINGPRVLQICTALQQLELPALVLHEIVFMACGEVPMHLYWSAITCVKHFHTNKNGGGGGGGGDSVPAAPAAASKVERRRVRRQP
jgi:ankyrin repeat protein